MLVLMLLFLNLPPAMATEGRLFFIDWKACGEALTEKAIRPAKESSWKDKELAFNMELAKIYLASELKQGEKVVLAPRISLSQSDNDQHQTFSGFVAAQGGDKIANLTLRPIQTVGPHRVPASFVSRAISQIVNSSAFSITMWGDEAQWDRHYRASDFRFLLGSMKDLFSIPTIENEVRTRIIVAIVDSAGRTAPLNDKQIPVPVILKKLGQHRSHIESIVLLSSDATRTFDFDEQGQPRLSVTERALDASDQLR